MRGKQECQVRFKIMRKSGDKLLHGLIFIEAGRQPTLQDYEQCLRSCGFDVRVEDAERFIFRAVDREGSFLIDVLEEADARGAGRDRDAEALARSFLKPPPPL